MIKLINTELTLKKLQQLRPNDCPKFQERLKKPHSAEIYQIEKQTQNKQKIPKQTLIPLQKKVSSKSSCVKGKSQKSLISSLIPKINNSRKINITNSKLITKAIDETHSNYSQPNLNPPTNP